MDILELVRARLGGHPLVLAAAFTIVFQAALRPLGASISARATRAMLSMAALAGAAAYLALAVWYASDPHFFDNAEPTMISVAWAWWSGGELYHAVDAAERYSHIYGPLAFMAHAAALGVLGPSIGVSKWLGVLAGLAGLTLVHAAASKQCGARRAAVLTGLCALFLLAFRNVSFWTRPDPLLFLLVAAGVFAADAGSTRTAAVLVALTSGALWSLKFTGPLYSLGVFALILRRVGWRTTAGAGAAAVGLAFVPFLWPGVSLANYMAWAELSGRSGLLFQQLRQNVEWAAVLCLPLALARSFQPGTAALPRAPAAALLAGVCGVVVAASKPGAGPYHLIPFAPVVAYLVALQVGVKPLAPIRGVAASVLCAVAATLVLLAAAQSTYLVTTMRERRAWTEWRDVEEFLRGHDGVVEMAYGRSESLSLVRPILTFRNRSYLVDQPAVREYQLQGVPFPRATIDAIARCRVSYWLVPRGEAPFSGVNGYEAVLMQPLYPDALRTAFAATHRLVESTRYYDVWRCAAAGER